MSFTRSFRTDVVGWYSINSSAFGREEMNAFWKIHSDWRLSVVFYLLESKYDSATIKWIWNTDSPVSFHYNWNRARLFTHSMKIWKSRFVVIKVIVRSIQAHVLKKNTSAFMKTFFWKKHPEIGSDEACPCCYEVFIMRPLLDAGLVWFVA